jgi:hypothetical protein
MSALIVTFLDCLLIVIGLDLLRIIMSDKFWKKR